MIDCVAVQIKSIQRCVETGEYTSVEVASLSDPEKVYTVLVIDAEEPSDNLCECEGFRFRAHCNHQIVASEIVCMWCEGDSEQQTNTERQNKICPRCGGPTEWTMIVDE